MAISLQKGGNVNLSKEAPGISKMVIGLGWDARATDGAAFDIDGSVFLLKADGKWMIMSKSWTGTLTQKPA